MSEINYNEEVRNYFDFVGTTEVKSIPKLGTVISANAAYNAYPSNFGFAFVSDKLEQASKFVTCRDYLHDAIRTFINGKVRLDCDCHGYANDKNCPDLSVKNMLLLIQIHENLGSNFSRKKAATAIKVLNDIEEFAGIPLTEVEEVTVDSFKFREETKIHHIMLKGSNIYMQNPHMLSMVTLIMRFCSYSSYGWYKRPANLSKWVESKAASKNDARLLVQCYKTLPILMKFRKEVFKGVSLDELFPENIKFSFHSKGGVTSLCTANTPNKKVNVRVLEMEKNIKKSITFANKSTVYRAIARNFF